MGKINYYSNGIEDRLRQVDINRNDIGMTQINVLPIPDGELEGSGDPLRSIEITAIGDKLSGKVSVEINGESNMREHPQFSLGWLTPLGRGENDTGIIKPGKYSVSFTCSMTASEIKERLHNSDGSTGSGWITVQVDDPDSFSTTTVYLGETEEITIPENFTKVRIYYDLFVNDDRTAAEPFNDDVTFDIIPFLRLKELEDEPFEPYKPDLQTQITELTARVEALERGGGGGGVTLITRAIDSNGTYDAADDNADGYYRVDVEVPEDPDYNETQTDTVTDEVEEVTQ